MERIKLSWIAGSLFLIITVLLVIQIRWLLKSAELKENHFQHRVTMALCSAVEDLSKDKKVCSALSSCSIQKEIGLLEARLDTRNKTQIEQVVKQHLQYYDIGLPFEVSLSRNNLHLPAQIASTPAKVPTLGNVTVDVDFPTRQQFIRSELNAMFFTSLFLLIILMIIFTATLKALFNQRKIQAATIDFIDTTSHELKTPINNISLAMTMLEKSDIMKGSSKIRRYLDIVKMENDTLRKKVNDVLELPSVESIVNNEELSKVDLHALINKSIKRFSVRLEDVKGKIKLDLMAQRTCSNGNQIQLESVLICLIDNALNYCVDTPVIKISTTNQGRNIVIEVKDNGVGIHESMHDKIFEKYVRAIPEEDVEGYGIGLFSVKKIIEAHGGSILLSSQPEKGSIFTLTLPVDY